MSGDLPFTAPRRRHHRERTDISVESEATLVADQNRKTRQTVGNPSTVGPTPNPTGDPLAGSLFSSLIANPAASLWNTAQTKLSPSSSWASLKQSESSENLQRKPFQDEKLSGGPFQTKNTYAIEEMPCRDRTIEFRTAAKSAQMKWHATANGHAEPRNKNHLIQQSIQFNQLAKRIGRDLSQTCAKMEKLADLAKRRSMFDDRLPEVEHLTQIIKQLEKILQDITGLNKQIGTLQELVKQRAQQNGMAPRPQGQNHSRTVVVGLQSKLATISNEFKQVLEIRTENMKQQKSRREMFGQSRPVPSNLPPSASAGNSGGSLLLADDAQASSMVAVDMGLGAGEGLRGQEQLTLMDDSYMQSRSSTMETIESSISELGTIFRQLANLVAEQGETITRIDSNVEETALHVEGAHMELLKYFRNISRNRWLMIKIFGVLVVFFIIFIVFMT